MTRTREPRDPSEASTTLARLGLSDLRPVYQPVVDLRDGRVVGYEALVRGGPDFGAATPAELFAAARAEDVVAEFDAACRAAAVRGFELDGAGPFALFLNAAADTLGDAAEQSPRDPPDDRDRDHRAGARLAPRRAAARAHPVPHPGLGRRARRTSAPTRARWR